MKLIYTLSLLFMTVLLNSQTNSLIINPGISLPKDSVEREKLIRSLNEFLKAGQKPNEENKFVFEEEKIETFILLDEINGIEKSETFNISDFYKPYLTNIVSLKENQFLISISYIGVNENKALLRACFTLIGHKTGDSYTFSSSLLRNTENWKVEKIGSHTFHYQNTINKKNVSEYGRLITLYDTKLNVPNHPTDYYLTSNIIELQKLIGVDYKSDYNGIVNSIWTSSLGNRKLIVYGNNNSKFDSFDPHDLFHDRLSIMIPRNKVNKPVDEGCAYLYGGSWGLSWEEIFRAFKEQVASNKKMDWKDVKENPIYFKTKEFNNSADYIVNALLVKKIEQEKGFAGVWELLTVGPVEKGNEKYYQTLEKLTGITKANYNEKVWELINKEK